MRIHNAIPITARELAAHFCPVVLALLATACGGGTGETEGSRSGTDGDGGSEAPDGRAMGDGPATTRDGGGGAEAGIDGGGAAARDGAPVITDGEFDFVVFGDQNGGGGDRNDLVARNVARMAAEPNVAFYLHTGDIIDGYEADGQTLCFAKDPARALGLAACPGGHPGNAAELLAPIKDRPPARGLALSLYPVIGNHDDNWGEWYPDPCGDGICAFLSPKTPADFINHPYSGDICSLTQGQSAYGREFYYSFAFQNSYFIVLHLNNNDENMLSACNTHPGHPDCASYCSDPTLAGDAARNSSCWGGAQQFDFLREELEKAQAYSHIFVFGHAPLLGSGDNNGPTADSEYFRELFDTYHVSYYFNGHNHAYERTAKIRGAAVDQGGTTYITVGSGGALVDGVNGDWFTAATYQKWTSWGDAEGNTTYVKMHVAGDSVTGAVKSLAQGDAAVDSF
jgi:hypothetical protein